MEGDPQSTEMIRAGVMFFDAFVRGLLRQAVVILDSSGMKQAGLSPARVKNSNMSTVEMIPSTS